MDMRDQKTAFVKQVSIRSAQFADKAEAFFEGNSLRAEIDDFWARNQELVTRWAMEYWVSRVAQRHADSATETMGRPVTREQVGEITAQLMMSIFTVSRETDWMKSLANVGIATWLVDNPGQMVRNLQDYSDGIMVRLKDEAEDLDQAMADILFVNRITLLQFEVIAAFRSELEVRYAAAEINRQGNDFVTSLAGKIDNSLKVSESVNEAANQANAKISGLRKDTTEAAAISEQSAQAMQDAAQTAGDLLQALNNLTDGLRDGKDILAKSVEQVERSANDNAQVVSEVSAIEEVVRTISQIAEQTNILALNASIEAARAGASGAGFAVVAQEVKNLATQTAKATDTVAERITAIQASSEKSRQSSGEMVETVSRLHATSDTLLTNLNDQLGGFSKITDAVDETAKGAASMGELVANVSRDTDTVAQMVERLSDASNGTASQLSTLVEEAGEFVRKIGT